jgi:hypothetical protein
MTHLLLSKRELRFQLYELLDSELTENIVHLVLAYIKGAPSGAKGVSLFLVPKVLVEDEGQLGARNNVALAAGANGSEHDLYRGKLQDARYFMEWELAPVEVPCAPAQCRQPHLL